MKKATSVRVGLAVVIALLATFSTARARQQWDESQSHSDFLRAQASFESLTRRAAAIGLQSSELAPYGQAAGRLAADPAPTSSPLWNPEGARFYSSQSKAYRSLGLQLKKFMRVVARKTRQQAAETMQSFEQAVNQAATLDMQVQLDQTILARAKNALASSSTPREYRSMTASLASELLHLQSAVVLRQQYVNGIAASARWDVAAVIGYADSEIAAVSDRLELLRLVSNTGRADESALSGLMRSIHQQPTAFAAAVKAADVHDLVTRIAADSADKLPEKMIVVSTENQNATAYERGKPVYSTLVTTGGPELPTDHGVFHIYLKLTPFTFHSPWPPGSPYYYPPTPITYWMPFDQGEGLHDAWWRSNFGPGSNLQPTYLGTGNYILGTHGCVNMPFAAAEFVWNWAPVGTTVVVV
jgi:hypothetical protein